MAIDAVKPSVDTTERVLEEVLSGNITNDEDVLEVALTQLLSNEESSQQSTKFSARSSESADESNSLPVITQVLETIEDEDGNVVKLVAETGLYAVDQNNDTLTTEKLINNAYGNLSAYSITANHTVYYFYRHTSDIPFKNEEVKIYKQVTYLYYYGNYQATRLEHYYYPEENALRAEYFINSYSNPAANTSYIDYPSNPQWVAAFTQAIAGFISTANVYYGSTSITIDVLVDSSPVSAMIGTW